jgi:predicted phosphodiesterase
MRYAIFGDIHGNWEALQTVLKDAQENGVDKYVCLGDIVGYNASPTECLEQVLDLGCPVVRGNHDHYCSYDSDLSDFHPLAAKVIAWTRDQLSDEHLDYLRSLRYSQTVGGFTIVHSTLDMPEKWGYVFEELEAETHFSYQTTSVCFHGHTHVPLFFEKGASIRRDFYDELKLTLGKKYFINVGSVGQPRDGDPRAAYVIYDTKTKEVKLRRLEYDIAAAQKKIRDAGLPERLAIRLEKGK